ncbi:hypothetical protein MMC10_006150 [Thelotrema lepadinum]|nr:hypothetical protein [Thelotrema lepadinum]
MWQLSFDDYFNFTLLSTLSKAEGGGSSVGEVLTVANQIVPGDFESYYNAFNTMAVAINATNSTSDAGTRDVMFRAATYWRDADFYLHGNWSDPRIETLWDQQLAAFDKAISLLPIPGERLVIQGPGFDIPVIFYSAGNLSAPTLLVGSGYDAAQEDTLHEIGFYVLARGWNFVTYEGPGQPTVRIKQGLGFIPDWEKVVTPVVDYLSTRSEVDMSRLALVGISMGGYMATRVAAFEHRFAAAIAIDGIYDFFVTITQNFPATITDLFASGNATAFDAYINSINVPGAPTSLRWVVDQGLFSFNTHSPFDWWTQMKNYTMDGITDQIPCPVFVAQGQADISTQGQPQEIAQALGDKATYHEFLTALGAGEHVQLGAEAQLAQVTLDWLQSVFANVTAGSA